MLKFTFFHHSYIRPTIRNFYLFQNLEKESFENVSEIEKNCIFICYGNTAGAQITQLSKTEVVTKNNNTRLIRGLVIGMSIL